MRWGTGALLDLGCVVAFVAIGRAEHGPADGALDAAGGLAVTAWPFVVGAAAGWTITRAWRRPAAVATTGLSVWLATVAVGMVLRALTGQGTAVAFVIVAAIFLGASMLGWRAVARWWAVPPWRARGTRQVPPAS